MNTAPSSSADTPLPLTASRADQIFPVLTGADLSPEELVAARSPLAHRPHLLETGLPGVFAVGDARSGNVKRVASAVGEGSIAISFVHQLLRE
jgi:thioredoxin reductase (NADPH)